MPDFLVLDLAKRERKLVKFKFHFGDWFGKFFELLAQSPISRPYTCCCTERVGTAATLTMLLRHELGLELVKLE